MSYVKAMERELGWMYTEYEESAYGNISIVTEWWGDEPTAEEITSGRIEIVPCLDIFT